MGLRLTVSDTGCVPGADDGRQLALLRQQLDLLFRGIPVAFATNVAAALLVLYAFWPVAANSMLLSWFAGVVLVGGLRLGLMLAWRRRSQLLSCRRWLYVFITGTAFAGVAWALIIIPLFTQAGSYRQLFLAFVFLGLSAAAVTSLSYVRTAALAYILPVLGALVVQFARQEDPLGGAMALAGLFFLIGLIFTTQRTYRYLIEHTQLAMTNAEQQEELAFKEARYHTLLDTAVDAFFLHNTKGRFVDVNQTACTSLGYSYEELLGMTVFDIEKNIDPAMLDGLWANLRQGEIETVRGIHRRKDGSEFPVEVRLGALLGESGDKLFSVLARDVTQRERAEEARRLSEARLAEAQKIAHLGYWEMDVVSGEIIWSDEIYRIFGVDPDHFVPTQTTFAEYLHPDDIIKMQKSYERGLAGEKQADEEWRIVDPYTGATKYIHVLAERLFDDAGRFVYMIGTLQDITARKQAEIAKDEFISTVSHELRTPLTSIRGAVGLLKGGAVGELPMQAQAMVDVASNNTQRLLLLINDILDIQKIETDAHGFHFQEFELTPWLQQALDEHRGYAEQHQIDYQLRSPDSSVTVYGDPDRLMQVLGNLLSNAAKFSPAGATVTVHTALKPGRVRIHVSDTGPGIPESFRDRLFDKFSQSDTTTTRATGGTGLGLSIARAIVDKHRGAIGYSSVEGQGAEFWFEVSIVHM